MFTTGAGVLIRIVSNSYLNVFQKVLTAGGQKSSVVNFYTYLGLSILGLIFVHGINLSGELIYNCIIMGLLGTLGNYFIIKALSLGDLSAIAPVNSYKPVVALLFGVFFLREIPSLNDILGIVLIIAGTYCIFSGKNKGEISKTAIFYRVLALIFSGTEAVFIKKVILLSNNSTAFFLWAFAGFLFSALFLTFSRHKPVISNVKYQLLLILSVGIMQYSTNFVFSKMDVAGALALFQLSTILSVFLGANIFHEQNLKRKLLGSIIMALGAAVIILA